MTTVDIRIIAGSRAETAAARIEELRDVRLTLYPPQPGRCGGVRIFGTLELPTAAAHRSQQERADAR